MRSYLYANRSRYTRKHLRRSLITVAVLALLVSPLAITSQTNSSARTATRIRFARGAITANVRGRFTRNQPQVCYLLSARAGQHMTLNIVAVTPQLSTAGQVTSPSGEQDGGPGGVIFDEDLTETGDYRICVNQHTMGSNLATGVFVLEMMVR